MIKKLILITLGAIIAAVISIGGFYNNAITIEGNVITFDGKVIFTRLAKIDSMIVGSDTIMVGDLMLHSIIYDFAPTGNGVLDVLGWYEEVNSSESLTSASPVTAAVAGYNGHYSIDLSSVSGAPFTLRVTGTSINESTGAQSEADTEDIAITGNGYVQTVKTWMTAPVFSIVEGSKSATIDLHRQSYWDRANKNFNVSGVRMEWKPDVANWNITIEVLKVNNDGSLSQIDSTTFDNTDTPPQTQSGRKGKYKRGDYDTFINGSQSEGIILRITQTGIETINLELRYKSKP